MKAFLVTIFFFSFFVSKGQQQNNNPDSTFTGSIITDKAHHTRIYLTGFKQTLDSSGVYTTTYIFGAKISRPTFDVNISMKFDAPLLQDGPIGFEYGPYGVGRFSGSGALRNNNLYLFLRGQMTSSNHHFYIKIKSKQKIHPDINGLDGQSNF
ncbi:MAG TPA: hypothetical protein VLS85_10295 [Hanamia sp.]|nr:hypothetical protein [Hanamia sp.]